MSAIQEDYILRMIQMMGELLIAAMHLKESGKVSEADQALDKILGTILPSQADLIEMVDVETAYRLLGESRLVESYIDLLLEKAELKYVLGESYVGQVLVRQTVEFFIIYVTKNRKLSPKGNLLCGRLSGLDLQKTLSSKDFIQFEDLKKR
ncbi:MAG: hypothetical protein K9N35_06515 [Candidatus Marinimicrobia bacterium]|nr:hypothetical protein [Candidatus Neomarinimicrobiota bacterium]